VGVLEVRWDREGVLDVRCDREGVLEVRWDREGTDRAGGYNMTCIYLTAGCYSIKKIQCNTVTSLQCCSLCDNLDSRYLYTCMDA